MTETDTSIAPPSLALPIVQVIVHKGEPRIAVPHDPWAPMRTSPAFVPPPPPLPHAPSGDPVAAAQIAALSRSRVRLDRVRAHADRLAAHAAELAASLTAAAEQNVEAAINRSEFRVINVEAVRGELVDVQRQHRQALAILADAEAEHARHEADLAALFGDDGEARAKLAEAHAARTAASADADGAKAVLDRAKGHAEAVEFRLRDARATEARHDADAAGALHAALREGVEAPAAAEPIVRTSLGLEDDLRAARAAVDRSAGDHGVRLAELAKAQLAVVARVDGVLLAGAEIVARELQAVEARAAMLRRRLNAYAARVPGDYVAPEPAKRALLQHSDGHFYHDPKTISFFSREPVKVRQTPVIQSALGFGSSSADPAEAIAWRGYATALITDPLAEPEFATVAPPLPSLAIAPFFGLPAQAPVPVRTEIRDAAPQRFTNGRGLTA